MSDIIEKQLTLGKLIRVIDSSNSMHHKLFHIDGRHSDAFVYVISGSCKYTTERSEFTANAGDVLYLAHGSFYTMYILSDIFHVIYCDFEFIESEKRKCHHYTAMGNDAEELFQRLLRASGGSDPSSYCEAMSLLYRIYGAVRFEANKRYVGRTAVDRIAMVKAYIDANSKNAELTVSSVAERAGMSQVYLRHLFRSQYGISPSRYITRVRLANALKLMEYPFLTVADCARESGFSTVQYFCKVFKKEFGETPVAYRKTLKSKET